VWLFRPLKKNTFDTSLDGFSDAFVTKLNASGSALAYSTFLGGTESDFGEDIAVRDGRAYVTGWTLSSDFPITDGAFDTTFNSSDAFVTKLPTG
jgi:Beta-propeller repeat